MTYTSEMYNTQTKTKRGQKLTHILHLHDALPLGITTTLVSDALPSSHRFKTCMGKNHVTCLINKKCGKKKYI